MKYISLALALLISTTTFATTFQKVKVINDTKSYVTISYVICDVLDRNKMNGGYSFFVGRPNSFNVMLEPLQSLQIRSVEQIDGLTGETLPDGQKANFSYCQARGGQNLRLVTGSVGRALGVFFCMVE